MHSSKLLSKILDVYSLAVALAVDALVMLVCFLAISPGALEAVGMGALSIAVTLFSVRAWLKGGYLGKVTWAMFAVVVLFFDLSFVLVSTDVQTVNATTTQDSEQVRLDQESQALATRIASTQQTYQAALVADRSKDVLLALSGQIQADQAAQAALQARLTARVDSGRQEVQALTAGSLSTAIYDAAISGKPGRITFLAIFTLLFAGLQLTIVTAASGARVQSDVATVQPSVAEPVQAPATVLQPGERKGNPLVQFVRVTWTYARNGRGRKAVPRDVFLRKLPSFDASLYDRLYQECEGAGFLEAGQVVESDEEKIIAHLKKHINYV